MINFDFELLRGIGLSGTLAQRARDAADAEADAALALMRVTAVHRTTVQLHDGRATHAARVLPRLLRGDDGADAIAVGDWVLVGADARPTPGCARASRRPRTSPAATATAAAIRSSATSIARSSSWASTTTSTCAASSATWRWCWRATSSRSSC